MGSPLRIPHSLIAFLASLVVGVLLVNWLRIFLAFSRGSPDLPVAMLIVTFSILIFNDVFVRCFEALSACFNPNDFPARVGPRGDGSDLSVVSLVSSIDDEA